MSKAVAEIGIGVGLAAASIFAGPEILAYGFGLVLSDSAQASVLGAMTVMGASLTMAGVADALTPTQPSLGFGVASPIAPWNYVYGRAHTGGVLIFDEENSSQGTSNNKILHRVYCVACHPCQIGADWELRLDGKAVPLQMTASSAPGYVSYSPGQTQYSITSISRTNGVVTMVLNGPMPNDTDGQTLQVRSVVDNSFNGSWTVRQVNPSDYTTWTYVCGGPDTTTSGGNARTTYPDYKDKIYVEWCNGNHTSTFQGLLASGTSWGPTDLCLGKTVVYIRMGYDDSVFPQGPPNISFVFQGKNDIFDPRGDGHGWTDNAALCIADYLSLPATKGGFGLQIGTDIPSTQLSSAANTCDETVLLAAGGSTHRYTCNVTFNLNTTRGTILKNLLSSCAGRLTYQGGTYMTVPGQWVTPTLQLSDADITSIVTHPILSVRDTCNAVKGTYVSPENNWQSGDLPAYMQDADHGFETDPYLTQDDGERIFKEANFPCTTSSAIGQRLEKILLLRLRNQMRVSIRCATLKAYQATALDVIQVTHPRYTWLNKEFEVLSSVLGFNRSEKGALIPYVQLELAETDPSIYDWNPEEQLTPEGYIQPNNVGARICTPPEDVTGYSGPGETVNGIVYPSTITTGADGRIQNSLYVRWTQPNDANVVHGGHIEVQWMPQSATAWTGLSKVDPSADHVFIPNVSDGQYYMTQVRAVNCAQVPSDWVLCGPILVSNVLSSLAYSGVALGPAGTLTAQGMSDGTAQIRVAPFTAAIGAITANVVPYPDLITGLNQSQLYYVYYIDPTFAGGSLRPYATQNPTDFEGKAGYFLIGSIVTPTYVPRYQPSTYADMGSQTTVNPTAAFDNNILTDAIVSGSCWSSPTGQPVGPQYNYYYANGYCQWSGFPNLTLPSALTLHLIAASNGGSFPSWSGWSAQLGVTIGSTRTVLHSFSATTTETDYTMTIPAGTNLSTVVVDAQVGVVLSQQQGMTSASANAQLTGFEIYIQ